MEEGKRIIKLVGMERNGLRGWRTYKPAVKTILYVCTLAFSHCLHLKLAINFVTIAMAII